MKRFAPRTNAGSRSDPRHSRDSDYSAGRFGTRGYFTLPFDHSPNVRASEAKFPLREIGEPALFYLQKRPNEDLEARGRLGRRFAKCGAPGSRF